MRKVQHTASPLSKCLHWLVVRLQLSSANPHQVEVTTDKEGENLDHYQLAVSSG
ncbi:MAG: hypothetical protein JG718_16345 [Candidatus Thiothrix moscowensis]|nr:hypothetical protein [Candidatus Thiothrix moscowensis]